MPSIPIAQFTAEIITTYQAKGRAKPTIRQVRQVLRELAAVGCTETALITDTAIGRWLTAHPDRTPATLKSHLRCISSLCTRAKKKGYIELDPFDLDSIGDWIRDDGRPAAPRRRWSKSPEQMRQVLARAVSEAYSGSWEAARLNAYVHALFLTGGRAGEIQRLEVKDFNARALTLSIHPKWITAARACRRSSKSRRWGCVRASRG